ncbi:MAG TPA: helix-turn-helix domain-containing protein [Reyranella sp.]|jgi:AraC-like DNA-binding protein
MLAEHFDTASLPAVQQLEGWQAWYAAMFDVVPVSSPSEGFVAQNEMWSTAGVTLSRVRSPANTVQRTTSLIRHNAIDHWVFTLSKRSTSDVIARDDASFEVSPQTPFILSLGEEMAIRRRTADERIQVILARDSFQRIAPSIDAARGRSLTNPRARMLADYILLLERNMPLLDAEAPMRLRNAVETMLVACLAPTATGVADARDQIKLTLMERVREAVRRNLRSHSLGPDKLCREAATSRSQLYRLLEGEGGVARYIQRQRLAEASAMLCDITNDIKIGHVAEMLCFADASTFSRAFRREFGMSPREARALSSAGLSPAPPAKDNADIVAHTFIDCLRTY